MGTTDLQQRQQGLDYYLRALVDRCDTRNSAALISFLKLNEYCPEIIHSQPKLIIKKQYLPRNE